MILIINTSLPGIELLYSPSPAKGCRGCDGVVVKKIETSTQSLSLPIEVEKLLNENNATFTTTPPLRGTPSPAKGICAIGVVVGPGSFTGIRLGIAYAKGLGIGLGVPVVPVNAFEIYLERDPDAFVAIDSGRSDLFVGAHDLAPCTMEIEQIETEQMKYAKTVGHKPFDLADAIPVVSRKSSVVSPIIPMYLRPSYAEINCKKD